MDTGEGDILEDRKIVGLPGWETQESILCSMLKSRKRRSGQRESRIKWNKYIVERNRREDVTGMGWLD